MGKDKGTEQCRKENCCGRVPRMKVESSLLLVGKRKEGSSAGAKKANGDSGERRGKKLIYQGKKTTSNTLMLHWNDLVLIHILTRRT